MKQKDKDYLFWRCKTNWHKKYHHYIDEWINNVLPYQLEYFRREMNNLINRGIYDTRKQIIIGISLYGIASWSKIV